MSKFRVLVGSLLFLLASSSLHAAVILSENFDNISTLGAAGWIQTNTSTAGGTTGWFQGNTGVFSSQAGAANAYIAANFENADFGGDISNWLITPLLSLQHNLELTFYTRTEPGSPFPDRLEVRESTTGGSAVGDFTSLLLTINPALSAGGYPESWTQYTLNIAGSGVASTGRFAFHYAVTDTSFNANYIGIDSVVVNQTITQTPVPEPGTLGLIVFGVAAAVLQRRLRRGDLGSF